MMPSESLSKQRCFFHWQREAVARCPECGRPIDTNTERTAEIRASEEVKARIARMKNKTDSIPDLWKQS